MRTWLLGGVFLLALLVVAAKFAILPRVRGAWGPGPGTLSTQPIADPRGTILFVTNSRNSPVPGATVTFRREGREDPVAEETVDGSGVLKFRLPDEEPGWSGLRVRARMGPLSREIVLRGHPGDALELQLPETVALHGLVVKKGKGTPLEGIAVRTGKGTVRTGEDGRFQIAFAPSVQFLDGSLRLEVLQDGGRGLPFQFPCTAADGDLVLEVE